MAPDSTAHITPQTPLKPALTAWEYYLADQGSSPHTITAFLGDLRLFANFLPPDKKIGEILLEDNYIREVDLDRALSIQNNSDDHQRV